MLQRASTATGLLTVDLTAGESAFACDALEEEAVFLLAAHGARCQQQQPLVLATLQLLAHRLGYPSLPAYFGYHMVQFIFTWCAYCSWGPSPPTTDRVYKPRFCSSDTSLMVPSTTFTSRNLHTQKGVEVE